MKSKQSYLIQGLIYLIMAFFIVLMLGITISYGEMKSDTAFLAIKQRFIHQALYLPMFYIHVWTSIWVLILGLFQWSPRLRKSYPKLHVQLGKTYVFILLAFAAPSGLYIGIFANGGWAGVPAFILLALLWWYSTFKAYQKARKKQWHLHGNWMVISYALTLSAITLRAWKWIFVRVLDLAPMDLYILVSWLGWVLNLLVALYIIKKRNEK